MKNTLSPEILKILNETKNRYLLAYRKQSYFKLLLINNYINFKIKIFNLLAGNDIKKSYKRRNNLDKLWIISLLKKYKKEVLLSEGEGRKIPFWNGYEFCVIDSKIAPIIFYLNKIGIKTNNSCEGNQNKGHSNFAYVSTFPSFKFPEELLLYLRKVNFIYSLKSQNNEFIGETIYPINEEQNELFIKTLNNWIKEQEIINSDNLKKIWKT